MGEAKRRMKEIEQLKEQSSTWRAALSPDELMILQLAERLDERLVRAKKFSEGCYYLAFFMTKYLASKDVTVIPQIGWINDGTWRGMTSHAWIEFNGKKTDVSLGCTSHPEAQPTGAVIAHDHILRKGMVEYSHYKNDPPEVQAGLQYMRSIPDLKAILAFKEIQHAQMLETAKAGIPEIDKYLSQAPSGLQYSDIARIVG